MEPLRAIGWPCDDDAQESGRRAAPLVRAHLHPGLNPLCGVRARTRHHACSCSSPVCLRGSFERAADRLSDHQTRVCSYLCAHPHISTGIHLFFFPSCPCNCPYSQLFLMFSQSHAGGVTLSALQSTPPVDPALGHDSFLPPVRLGSPTLSFPTPMPSVSAMSAGMDV
jgi:hypothetical protein